MHKRIFLLTAIGIALIAPPASRAARHPAYRDMMTAARLMQKAQRAIYKHKLALNLVDETLDTNRTGMIGVEMSDLTSTPGSLRAKRSSTNPDFAAYIVRSLYDHELSPGDTILVAMTGSFPALNIALLCALEALDYPAVIMSSQAASSYGANQEECTWIDMEHLLNEEGIISRRSDVVTLGASGDLGGGLPESGKEWLRYRAERLGYEVLEAANSRKQAALRKKVSGTSERFSLLINIGGNQVVLGREGRELPGGWIDPDSVNLDSVGSGSSLIFDFLREGIPVINLLHVEGIAASIGLPVDPVPLPEPGRSALYLSGVGGK